nr:putative salivary protein [Nilaparvata lugens]
MKSFYGLMLLMIWAGLEITEVVSTEKFDFEVFDVNDDKILDMMDLGGLSSFTKFNNQFKTPHERTAILEVLKSVLDSRSINSNEWESSYKAIIISKYNEKINAEHDR